MKNTASYVTARHKRAKLSSSVSLQIMSLPPLVANILEKSIYHFCPGKTLASAASRFYLQILASLTSILPAIPLYSHQGPVSLQIEPPP